MKDNKWIDISLTIRSGMVHWPGDPSVNIKRTKNMDKGDKDNVSFIKMGSHTGTHMDAPLHFIKNEKGLDKMPLDAVIGRVRVLGIRDKFHIGVKELKTHSIKSGERIIFKTKNSSYWKKGIFHKDFVYMPSESAAYLASLGVKTVGVDYLSVGGYHKDGAQTHKILLKAGTWIIEGLNLYGVKPDEYDLICLPLKILNSDGAPARAIIRRRGRYEKSGGYSEFESRTY
jgi:arylformamidase